MCHDSHRIATQMKAKKAIPVGERPHLGPAPDPLVRQHSTPATTPPPARRALAQTAQQGLILGPRNRDFLLQPENLRA
jgi:hypothetical protein